MPKGQKKTAQEIRLVAEMKIERQWFQDTFRVYRDDPTDANLDAMQTALESYHHRFNILSSGGGLAGAVDAIVSEQVQSEQQSA